jgi:hypothetical protein
LGIQQEDQGLPLSHANIATPTKAFVLFLVTRLLTFVKIPWMSSAKIHQIAQSSLS